MLFFTVCLSLCVKMRYVILSIKRLLIDWSIDVQVEQATSAVHKSHQLHVYTTNGEFTGCPAIFSNSILRRNSTTNFNQKYIRYACFARTSERRHRVDGSVCPRTHTDCETHQAAYTIMWRFVPPLMSKTTIRIPDEGGWSGVGGTYVCGAATAKQLSRNLTRTELAKMPKSRFESMY